MFLAVLSRRLLFGLLGGALALVGWLLLAPATPVAAIAYTVNTLTDTCAGLSTTGDLCFVINNVNLGSGNDTITITATGTINLTSALPHLTKGVTITGPTSGVGVTVNGGGANTVFIVDTGVTASISRLTIANGHGGSGGGILNNGTLTVTNTTFAGNVAPNSGGGIFNNGGTLHVTNSTFSGNSAPGNDGGGIVNFGGGGTVTVTNSTFTGNSAARGGGIQNLGSTVTLTNTIVAGNSATSSGPDLAGAYTSGGYNLVGMTSVGSGITQRHEPRHRQQHAPARHAGQQRRPDADDPAARRLPRRRRGAPGQLHADHRSARPAPAPERRMRDRGVRAADGGLHGGERGGYGGDGYAGELPERRGTRRANCAMRSPTRAVAVTRSRSCRC